MTDSDLAKVQVRRLAEHQVRHLDAERALASGQHVDLFKWLNASILAINSGGCLAVMNTDKITGSAKMQAGCAFVAGIFFAMMIGVCGQAMASRLFPALNEQTRYWLSVCDTGVRSNETEQALISSLNNAQKRHWIVPTMGWVSGVCFAVGMAFICRGFI